MTAFRCTPDESAGMREQADSHRCRYEDCPEAHQTADEGEQVTCGTCRYWMGLPSLAAKSFRWPAGGNGPRCV